MRATFVAVNTLVRVQHPCAVRRQGCRSKDGHRSQTKPADAVGGSPAEIEGVSY